MKPKNKIEISFLLLLFTGSLSFAQATVKLEADMNAPVINKNIYGHFAEHLGRCIYGGLYVGEKSNIPNTQGVRNDIINALKELKIPTALQDDECDNSEV